MWTLLALWAGYAILMNVWIYNNKVELSNLVSFINVDPKQVVVLSDVL